MRLISVPAPIFVFGGGFNPVVPPNKAFPADGQDSPFFEVNFGTLSQSYGLGSVAAAEMRAFKETGVLKSGANKPKGVETDKVKKDN